MEIDRDLVNDCVHCGFCLPSCPTYVLWHEEMDSPRGRIRLMEQYLDGAPVTGSMLTHIDRCLGCLACVTACPSGVRYDRLIEATRATVEREYRRGPLDRAIRTAIFAVFPYPRRMRVLVAPLRAYQRSGLDRFSRLLPGRVRAMMELIPRIERRRRLPARLAARGPRRARVGLLTGCVQDALFSAVNAATARVLAAEGCDVIIPNGQSCCGALSVHNGREAQARHFARRTIATFERARIDAIVVNVAGCGSTMKDYGALLADDPRWAGRAGAVAAKTRDLTEFLVDLGPRAPRHPLPLRVAYQDACHLAHGQGIRVEPRSLLTAIPELELVEPAEPELCCGSAGIYNVLQPGAARELGDRKATQVLRTRAEVMVTGNPGCLMQLSAALRRQGSDLPVVAMATLLDAAIAGTPLREPGIRSKGNER